jgi:hypothetical protein
MLVLGLHWVFCYAILMMLLKKVMVVRILGCWKMAILIFRAHHHHKYALASLHLQEATQASTVGALEQLYQRLIETSWTKPDKQHSLEM